MKKGLKTLLCGGLISCMVLGSAVTSFAGSWKQGADPSKSWWYDWFDYFVSHGGGDVPLETHIVGWAESSERGAAWKALFDRYGLSYTLANDHGVNVMGANKELSFTSPAGMTNDDSWAMFKAIEMLFRLGSDGMTQVGTGYLDLNDDTTVTVRLDVRMMG